MECFVFCKAHFIKLKVRKYRRVKGEFYEK